MRKLNLVLVFLLFAALLLAAADPGTKEASIEEQRNPSENLRSGNGDVIVRLNGCDNVAYIGDTNTVEIWIRNDTSLTEINLQFEFAIGRNYQFDPNYGSTGYSNPEGDVLFLELDAEDADIDNLSPDTIQVYTADMMPPGFPPHYLFTLAYTMQVYIEPGQSELTNGFCINCSTDENYWYFYEESLNRYSPTFNGYPHTGAPPICFDIVESTTPAICGDVNCDDVCNVSDAVAIINYIFVGGYSPCDPSGDGIPDC